ncbi:MAG: hypothetical protein Q8M39_03860 [Sulfuricurvum sp.]|nr:hypothetical protein [Sulfuricurvum sp.]
MTYNNKGVTGCSARGIAKRESKEELLVLAEQLKDAICNIHIEKINNLQDEHIPMELFENMKELK